MALDPRTWLDRAKELDAGQETRTTHDCGPGRVLKLWHNDDGWSAWCHRCAEGGFAAHPSETLEQRLARVRRKQQAVDTAAASVSPPMPAEFDPSKWPVSAQVWLYKAGLNKPRIQQLGFYWHEPTQRVVLPVFQRGELVFWQGRSLDPNEIKYINPTAVDRTRLVYECGSGTSIVLTEDILSAVRVGEVTEAWSLLGTNLPDPILTRLITCGKPVHVWLDPDDAGIKAMNDIDAKLRLMGIAGRKILSTRDPKLLSKEDIECLLS